MYLLDTNVLIFLFKGHLKIAQKIKTVGFENCAISEITVAELLFGAENSQQVTKNMQLVEDIQKQIAVIPIWDALGLYAREKTRLKKAGTPIDDFDLLIGTTTVVNDLILVSNNIKHLGRISNILIEDWMV